MLTTTLGGLRGIPEALTWVNTTYDRSATGMSDRLEEAPMRNWTLTILTVSLALTAGHARAQRYDPAFPVCLNVVSSGTSPYYRCSYRTMDECRASANGQTCVLNPYYAGATAKGNNRRHSRQTYTPARPPIHHRAAPYNQFNEPYYGASQGYAPGEKERFLQSTRQFM
ncbi:DUF3551 domain-containing protein [Bradyrhizobium manausense]|uniref:DUF3551 domain-containing protein n=1 Tax=Bradyrhizobium manausense TaxID=989370 RepID=UPI00289C48B2|nr:DUF3551 domain-containing protein [Bradyrhizobium manausense]